MSIILYFLAGFLQEIFAISWHRAVNYKWNLIAAMLTTFIAALSMLVISGILTTITKSHGIMTCVYVATFCLGKGIGAYFTLTFWDKAKH